MSGSRGSIPPPARPPGASRYGWFVGVVVVLIIAYITANTATTPSNGSRGPDPGRQAPPFAVPLALSDLNGDADIATRPGQGQAGRRPACTVRGPKILNLCQLYASGPVALALFVPAGDCSRTVDELVAAAPAGPGVRLAAVAVRGNRGDVRKLIGKRGWAVPVGYDHDGALADLYRMAVCAQTTFLTRGGRVSGASLLGVPAPSVLRARLAALAAARGR